MEHPIDLTRRSFLIHADRRTTALTAPSVAGCARAAVVAALAASS